MAQAQEEGRLLATVEDFYEIRAAIDSDSAWRCSQLLPESLVLLTAGYLEGLEIGKRQAWMFVYGDLASAERRAEVWNELLAAPDLRYGA